MYRRIFADATYYTLNIRNVRNFPTLSSLLKNQISLLYIHIEFCNRSSTRSIMMAIMYLHSFGFFEMLAIAMRSK